MVGNASLLSGFLFKLDALSHAKLLKSVDRENPVVQGIKISRLS